MALPFLILAVALLVDPAALDPLRFKGDLLLLLAPVVFAASVLRRNGELRRAAANALPWPLGALTLWLGVAVVLGPTLAHNDPAAWRGAALRLIEVIAAVLAWHAAWKAPWHVPLAVVAAATACALLAIAQVAGVDPLFDNPDRLAVATFGNTNAAGEFLAPALPLALALVFAPRDKGSAARKATGFAAASLVVAAIVLTGSRGAMLAGAAGVAVTLLVPRFTGAPGARPGPGLAAAAIALGVALPGMLFDFDVYSGRSVKESDAALSDPEYPTNKQRLLLWRATAEMIGDGPTALLVGRGPGSFRVEFPRWREPAEAALVTRFGARSEAEDPHDEFLLRAAEDGIVGLLLLLAFALPALFAFRGAALLPGDDARRPVAAGLAGAIAAALVAGLVRSPLENPATALLFFAACGQALAFRHDGGDDRVAIGRPGAVVLLAALALPCVVGLRGVAAGLALRPVAAAGAGEPIDAAALAGAIDDSLSRDASAPKALEFAGAFLLRAADRPGVDRAAMLARAAQVYDRFLALYPFSIEGRIGRAEAVARAGGTHAAARALRDLAVAHRLQNGWQRPAPRGSDLREGVALLEERGRVAAAAALLVDMARRGEAPWSELTQRAEAAEQRGDAAAALRWRMARLDLHPFDGDAAFASGELLRAAGLEEQARTMFRRAHQGFALEKLARGDWDGARSSVQLARHYQPGLEEDVLDALSRVGDASIDSLPPDLVARRGALREDFRQALLRLEANAALAPAVKLLAPAGS